MAEGDALGEVQAGEIEDIRQWLALLAKRGMLDNFPVDVQAMLDALLPVIASGVAGNVAYDLLKSAVRLARHGKTSAPGEDADVQEVVEHGFGEAGSTEALDLLAYGAVIGECLQRRKAAPQIQHLEVEHWERVNRDGSWCRMAIVRSIDTENGLVARVWLPERGLMQRGVDVQLRFISNQSQLGDEAVITDGS